MAASRKHQDWLAAAVDSDGRWIDGLEADDETPPARWLSLAGLDDEGLVEASRFEEPDDLAVDAVTDVFVASDPLDSAFSALLADHRFELLDDLSLLLDDLDADGGPGGWEDDPLSGLAGAGLVSVGAWEPTTSTDLGDDITSIPDVDIDGGDPATPEPLVETNVEPTDIGETRHGDQSHHDDDTRSHDPFDHVDDWATVLEPDDALVIDLTEEDDATPFEDGLAVDDTTDDFDDWEDEDDLE